MEIAVIGAGGQGTALGAALEKAGHRVTYGVRDPSTDRVAGSRTAAVVDAARLGDVVAIVVPTWHLEGLLTTLRTVDLRGKIVLDVTNPLTPEKGWARGFSTSNAELVRDSLPGARVVKAFNTVFAAWLRDGGRAFGQQLTGFVASDEAEAKQTVLQLVAQVGLDPVDAGGLAMARLLEAAGVMLVQFGGFTTLGWDLGLRLVHPAPADR